MSALATQHGFTLAATTGHVAASRKRQLIGAKTSQFGEKVGHERVDCERAFALSPVPRASRTWQPPRPGKVLPKFSICGLELGNALGKTGGARQTPPGCFECLACIPR